MFQSRFNLVLFLICISYFAIEISLIPHLTLAYDELWFGQHIIQYLSHVPYRDFLPYKTILGYYFLALPMFFFEKTLTLLFEIKFEIAFINALTLGILGFYTARFFNKKAIITTLLLIICNQLFLFYSVQLRVDMLAVDFGLLAILFILYQRPYYAGLLLGLSFLISQKALWFFIAINMGLVATLFLSAFKKPTLISIFRLNLSALTCITFYLFIGFLIAEPALILNNVFYDAYIQSKIHWYSPAYTDYWKVIIANGPLLILMLPLTWLGFSSPSLSWHRAFIIVMSSTLMALLITYQQPFPYNLVFSVPAFFFLYADFFTELLYLSANKSRLMLHKNSLNLFIGLYIVFLVLFILYFEVTVAYFILLFIPIGLAYGLHCNNEIGLKIVLLSIVFTGLVYPAIRTLDIYFVSNNDYQSFNIALAEHLLKNEDTYLAGTPLLYTKSQSFPGLENLISPQLGYLYSESPNLVPILLSSLHLAPISQTQALKQLAANPIKLYINNNRMHHLPPALLNYLARDFSHYWSSIYIYTPTILATQKIFTVKFKGMYRLISPSGVTIDHHLYKPNSLIAMDTTPHTCVANTNFRLKFQPDLTDFKLKSEYKEDEWLRVVS